MDIVTVKLPINISLRLLKLSELSNRPVDEIIIRALKSKSCKRIIPRDRTFWHLPYNFQPHEIKIEGRMMRKIKAEIKRLNMDFDTYIESAVQRYLLNSPDSYWRRKLKQTQKSPE